jgi:hypothetical protein
MIFAADIHLRRTTPRARVDDYWSAQQRKFITILEHAVASPPLVIAGDLFHVARPGEGLLRWTIALLRQFKVTPVVIPGQHDMPGHSMSQMDDSGLGVLAAAGVIHLLPSDEPDGAQLWGEDLIYGVPYGQQPPNIREEGWRKILLWHHMVTNDPLWPGQEADKALGVLRKYPQFNVIVTGDNHQTFCIADTANIPLKTSLNRPGDDISNPNMPIAKKVRWIVNPGSMMRMTAAQVDHKPCIFKYEGGPMQQIFLPIASSDDVLDLTELESAAEKDERVQAFVERLNQQWEAGLSFEKNLENFFRTNRTDPEVEALVWRCLE